MVFKMCEGILGSSFSVKELDVIVHKKYFPCIKLLNFGHSVPTSLANLVVEVGTRHCHQILLHDCHSASEVILKDVGKITSYHTTTKNTTRPEHVECHPEICVAELPIFFRVDSMALGQWHHCPNASWLFTQVFIQAHIKENIKALRHWPLWGEFTSHRWIPRTKGQ